MRPEYRIVFTLGDLLADRVFKYVAWGVGIVALCIVVLS